VTPHRTYKGFPGTQARFGSSAFSRGLALALFFSALSIAAFYGGGLLGVEPGTRFELEKAPVTEDIWLPTHFAMRSRSKIVFFVPHKTQEEETYWGYQKVPSDQVH
jgi:hypothetical protein